MALISASSYPDPIRDVIEYGRGTLAGLAYTSPDRCRDVNVLRLRSAFDRAGLARSLRYVLRVLDLMREVQELASGYWIPTPARLVPLEESALVVAPASTEELRRHISGVERAGYARILKTPYHVELPRQSLKDWSGIGETDTKTWTRLALQVASKEMSPTVALPNVEYFGADGVGSDSNRRVVARWTTEPKFAASAGENIVLCRFRISKNYYKHFFGTVLRGKLAGEAPCPADVIRIQYGIAALSGHPLTVLCDEKSLTLTIFSSLPRPERRLLLGLATRKSTRTGKTYEVRAKEQLRVITGFLGQLGCEIQRPYVG